MANKYLEPLVSQRVHIDKVIVRHNTSGFYIVGESVAEDRYYYFNGHLGGWEAHPLGTRNYLDLRDAFIAVDTFNMQEVSIDITAWDFVLAGISKSRGINNGK